MKTKSAVSPRKTQSTVLNLERLLAGAASVEAAIFPPQMVRRSEGRIGRNQVVPPDELREFDRLRFSLDSFRYA